MHVLTPNLTKIKTGLTLIAVPMPAVRSITTLVLANTGSRYEQENEWGVAHFFEHMVFKGTNRYPTAQQLASTVDGIGAQFNAYTSNEYTGYYVKAASEHIELQLDVLSDMLLQPLIRIEDLEREKGVIIEELNTYVDQPQSHIANTFEQMVFADSGLGHDIIGTKESIQGISQHTFHSFLDQWYGLGNLTLVVAGDAQVVGSDRLLELVNQAFAKEVARARAEKWNHSEWFGAKLSQKRLVVEERKTEQAHVIVAWPGIKRTAAERYALSVASNVLGGTMSSRLFSEIREQRGLCYYIHSDMDTYHDTGLFGASMGVDPKRVEEALGVTLQEFYDLAEGKKPVSDEELHRSKEYVAGSMILGFENSSTVAQYFGMRHMLQGTIETPEEALAKIRAVTIDEVQVILKKLVKRNELRLGVIGNFATSEVFEKFL